MSYTPKNLQVFNAAYCGCLAGMGLSDRIISNTDPTQYAGLATVAGAFAQAIDTQWGAVRVASLLDTYAIQLACAAYWQNRSPNADSTNTSAANWTQAANAVLAPLTASESYFASQGITPPVIPGGNPTGGGNIVANLTALAAIATGALQSGASYWVQTLKTNFVLDTTNTATPNGITVIAATGGGNWLRNINYGNPAWLTVNNWYINATTGNDENDGQTVGTPLKTHAELQRRWATGIITPTFSVLGRLICVVTLQTSLPPTDPVNITCIMGQDVFLFYQGGGAGTTLATGAFTAVTAKTESTNTPFQLTDTSISSFTPYLGKRWRITSGARQGTVGWVAKDLGSNTFRSSQPFLCAPMNPTNLPNNIYRNQGGSQQTPVIGDPYVIEDLVTIQLGYINPQSEQGAVQGNRITFGEVAIRSNGVGDIQVGMLQYQSPYIYASSFAGPVDIIDCDIMEISNTLIQGAIIVGGSILFEAGLSLGSLGIECYSGMVKFTNSHMSQGVGIRGSNICIDDACVFDSTANVSLNPGGHGLAIGVLRTPGIVTLQGIASSGTMNTSLWGSGNAGVGVFVNGKSAFNVNTANAAGITITGTGGDFKLNNNATANVWDQTQNAGAGAFLVPRNCTWANFKTSVAGGGFGGFAQDVPSLASIGSITLQ